MGLGPQIGLSGLTVCLAGGFEGTPAVFGVVLQLTQAGLESVSLVDQIGAAPGGLRVLVQGVAPVLLLLGVEELRAQVLQLLLLGRQLLPQLPAATLGLRFAVFGRPGLCHQLRVALFGLSSVLIAEAGLELNQLCHGRLQGCGVGDGLSGQ